MTGAKIEALRKALGLELPWFASLLGLHARKLQYWEASEDISLHPLQAHILAVLEVQVRLLGPHAPELGQRILKGIMLYGPPYGLLTLLQTHFAGRVAEFVPAGNGITEFDPTGDSEASNPKRDV